MRRGFTLIEMMIVIAVMAILIGIALPYFRGMQEEGWSIKAAGELRTLATAIESYYIHNDNQYPAQRTTGSQVDWQSNLPGNGPKIIASDLHDPFEASRTAEYCYLTSAISNSQYYVVFSTGPDGAPNITGIDDDTGVIAGGGDDIYFTNAEAGASF